MTIVVPFTAGSITDGLARILADKLGEMWKQQVIVENKPGIPGTTSVAKAAPDGYTLMLTSNHTIAGAISKSLQYDPVKDFAGVSQVASVPLVAVVPEDSPAKTPGRLYAGAAKSRQAQFRFGWKPVLDISCCRRAWRCQDAMLEMVHVPFKGVPE